MSALRKPVQSDSDPGKGLGWVPSWMADEGIDPNGAVTLSKLQLRSMMRPNKPLKVQVWACGMLHTAGYGGQVAWIMREGKRLPLRSADIARILHTEAKLYYTGAGIKDPAGFSQCKETKEHIRAALADLDSDGVSERQRDDGKSYRELSAAEKRRLPSGRTRICFYVKPRAADPENIRREWSDRTMSRDDVSKVEVAKSSLPVPPIHQTLKLFRIAPFSADQIVSPEAYQRAFMGARETFVSMLSEVANISLPQVATPEPPEVANGSGTIRKGSRNGEGKEVVPSPAKIDSSSSSSSTGTNDDNEVNRPTANTKTQDWDGVGRAAGQYFPVDDAWIRRLVKKCQERQPDITPAELAQLVHVKGAIAMKKDVPGGFLLTAVPNLCEGESFRRLRERLKQAEVEAAQVQQSHQVDPVEDLSFAIEGLRETPRSVNAAGWGEEVGRAQAENPQLYAAALARADERAAKTAAAAEFARTRKVAGGRR